MKVVNEILDVLVEMSPEVIHYPQTLAEWYGICHADAFGFILPTVFSRRQNAAAFEEKAGFPGVAGAVDGSLIRIQRPKNHEGWYTRKGWCGVNMQGVCDAQMRFIDISIRAGKWQVAVFRWG